MLPSSSSTMRQTIPIMCKLLLCVNIILFLCEFLMSSLVSSYCLSPQRIYSHPIQYAPSLFLSNFFHLNPLQSGPMGVFHILFNMMTLLNVGTYLEKQFGSISFIGITVCFVFLVGPLQIPLCFILNTISMQQIALFSPNQCGIGFSAILFAYFIVYLKIIPNQTMNVYGVECKKWMLPFIQLLILSFLLKASFIGHLSGIFIGLLYITGIPGCFDKRHAIIKQIEGFTILKFITDRNDFYAASQQPILSQINLIPTNSNSPSSQISYSRVTSNDNSAADNAPRVQMTVVNGVLVKKSSVTNTSNSQN